MKKYRYLGIIAIVIFSFYYTEKIATLTLENNTLFKTIKNNSTNYDISPVNASIDGDNIVPGLNGKKVNIKSSYYNMKDFNLFNDYFLIYDTSYPDISINNNKDKVINKGNELKNEVSFILEYDLNIINYFKSNSIMASILVNKDEFDKKEYLEQINNDVNNYNALESLLNHYNKNTHICYINNYNINLCHKNKKYLVNTNKIVNNSSLINIKNNITSGDIYYIPKNTNINEIQLLINSIMYKDLDIVSLSKLISEERD